MSSAGDDNGIYNSPKRTNDILYLIVNSKKATYRELKYEYTLEEFLDLYEICMVELYNKDASIKSMKSNKPK